MSWRVPSGAVLIGLGIFLAVRPFTALAVLLGLTALTLIAAGYALVGPGGIPSSSIRRDRRRVRSGDDAPSGGSVEKIRARLDALVPPWLEHSRPTQIALGLLLTVTGVAAVAWPRVTYAAFAYLPLLALLGYGLFTLVHFAFAARMNREGNGPGLGAQPLIVGPAAILLSFAGWRWPDVVLMLLAIVAGATLVVLGVRLVHPRTGGNRHPHRRWRTAGLAVALPAAAGMLILSGYLGTHPTPDAFYTPPEDPSADAPGDPGELLRAEPFPAPAGASAQRILYTTTRDGEGAPAVASAVVFTPDGAVDAPVIAWAHGTTGQVAGCAPSLTSMESGGMLVLEDVLTAGWAVVATDYTGLGTNGSHPYMIGEGEGRSVIDSVRAAGAADLGLSEETVVWGHSQGGHAALWAAGMWQDYAPEIPLLGIAAFAPAADVPAVFDSWATSRLANPFSSYALTAYGAAYDDVEPREYVRPSAGATGSAFAARCLEDPGTAVTLTASLLQETTIWSGREIQGPLRERAEENIPTRSINVPLLVTQGEADGAIARTIQDGYVANRCAAGWPVDYRTYEGLDHMPLVEPGSPAIDDAFLWTAALFSGNAVPDGIC